MKYIDQIFLKGSLIQYACIHLFWQVSTDHCKLYCVNTSMMGEMDYYLSALNYFSSFKCQWKYVNFE